LGSLFASILLAVNRLNLGKPSHPMDVGGQALNALISQFYKVKPVVHIRRKFTRTWKYVKG